jgi:uncharacterized protein YndB with AHSA1/START domain
MAELTFTIDFAVPPNEVFVFFVPQRMPLWYGVEMDACFEVQERAQDFATGQKVRIAGHLGSHALTLTVVVTAYEWGRLLEWRFQDSYGVRGLQRWELAPAASGSGTHLTMRDSYEMPSAFGRFFDRVFTRRAVALRDRAWLARLQQLVPQGAAAES